MLYKRKKQYEKRWAESMIKKIYSIWVNTIKHFFFKKQWRDVKVQKEQYKWNRNNREKIKNKRKSGKEGRRREGVKHISNWK